MNLVLLIAALLLVQVPPSWAQEQVVEEAVEELDYTFGEVTSTSGNELVINEFDFDQDDFVDNTYTVDDATEYEGFQNLQELKAGDTVEIDFVTQNGKRMIKHIAVTEPLEEEVPEEPAPQT